MSEENLQKELFDYEPQKKSFSKLTDLLPKTDFDGKVSFTLSLEKLVFVVISIIMAMVIIYALGVESGKRQIKIVAESHDKIVMTERGDFSKKQQFALPGARIAAEDAAKKNIFNMSPIIVTSSRDNEKNVKTESVNVKSADAEKKPFTIIVGTFENLNNAKVAGNILKQYNFKPIITYSKPYYRVYVGSYAAKADAEAVRDLKKVRNFFKDAMFKIR